jgi:hypothetical protein
MSLRHVTFVFVLVVTACGGSSPVTPPPPSPVPTAPPVTAPPVTTPPNPLTACGVGKGPGDGGNCPRTSPSFLNEVDAAINRVVARHPEWFNLDDQRGREGYLVINSDDFYTHVVGELGAAGLCARVDGGQEIAVKSDNNSSDQYHIMLSSRHIRRGDASYRATCYPAWF